MSDFYCEYDARHRVLAVRVTGAVTAPVMKACYETLARLLAVMEVRAAFLDLSEAGEFEMSADAVRGMSKLAPLLPDPLPRYIVAPRDHIFGMARMFQITSDGRDTLQIVRSADDVYAALGLDAPRFERLDMR